MGHAARATTDHYRRWAERQMAGYDAYMPAGLDSGKEAGKLREDDGNDSGKPNFRVVSG